MGSLICGNEPAIPKRILHASSPIPVRCVARRLNRSRPGAERSLVSRVRVRHIHMQVARLRLILSMSLVDFKGGVADPHGCVQDHPLR